MHFIIAGNASFVKEISLLHPGADWAANRLRFVIFCKKVSTQKRSMA